MKEHFTMAGFILGGMVLGGLIGGLYGTLNVVFFEQTESGRYASYEECVKEICYADSDGANCNCKNYQTVAVPLGKRIKDQALYYAFIWGLIGFGPGAVIGNNRWNKKQKQTKFTERV